MPVSVSLKSSVHLLFAALLVLVLLPAPLFAAQITLKVHHFLGADSMAQKKLIEPWASRVEKQSGGRIKVEIHPDMELGGKSWDLVKQVKKGTVDIVWTAAAYTPELFRATQVFTLPLVHKGNAVITNIAISKMLNVELKADYQGLHPLLVHVHKGHVFHSTKPLKTLDDFKAVTLRAPGRNAGKWTLEALGAQPTKKRHPSLPKAIRHKLLDGTLMSFALAQSMGVADVATHHTFYGDKGTFGTSLYMFLMNEKRYNELPADLRTIIDKNSGEAFAREMGQVWQQAGDEALAVAKKQGHTITAISGAEQERLHEALNEVLSHWAKFYSPRTIKGLELMRTARSAIRASQ